MPDAPFHLFGIRHHGPGCARSLVRALTDLKPDLVLLEGPPDADDLVALAAHEELRPPIALLVYAPDDPHRAVFYPFAEFSPEWQAIRYALRSKVPVRFMDLPHIHRLVPSADQAVAEESRAVADDESAPSIRIDPIGCLAKAAGHGDGERWWDQLVETRRLGDADTFRAVAEAMTTVREDVAEPDELLEQRREAYMRSALRNAKKDGFTRIAVVCGAWHVPALVVADERGRAASDAALLKGLPKTKTAAAWVPWSYDRLSFRSGYGAGVESPEWYHLLWTCSASVVVEWLTRAARLMRSRDVDASSANIIEAVRLAETLAAFRGRATPSLEELDEAALAVMCFGETAPIALIRRKLVIGDRLGAVPDDAPKTPLQQDLAKLQTRLRLPVRAEEKDYDLDLRKPMDLERSHLLHRLGLLSVPWGELRDEGRKKGTFHEFWRLQWHPEFVVAIIDAARFGSTVAEAATAVAARRAQEAATLAELTALLDIVILADLPSAVADLISLLQARTAVSGDVLQLMGALPALGNVCRYGNVRQTDAALVRRIVDELVARICVGLPSACASLSDEAAAEVMTHIDQVESTLKVLQDSSYGSAWNEVLRSLADQTGIHGLIAGRAARFLHQKGGFQPAEIAQRMSVWTSRGTDPMHAAAWLEGFLAGSGLVLLHDESLWNLMDQWVAELSGDHFQTVLPLLRRTFSTFPAGERRQMGERAKRGARSGSVDAPAASFDTERADRVLPLLAKILGVEWST